MFCTNCGAEIVNDAKFCVNCGNKIDFGNLNVNSAKVDTQKSNSANIESKIRSVLPVNIPVAPINNGSSYFDGTGLGLIGWSLLGGLVTVLTFGICAPLANYWITKWETEHSVINNKRFKYNMSGGQYFLYYLGGILLTIITFGIYGIFFPYNLMKKNISMTSFEGEMMSDNGGVSTSRFDGKLWKYLGMLLLCTVMTICSFGIMYPFAIIVMIRWETKHTIINNKRLHFDGSAWSLFGLCILCSFLTIITFGIYIFWVPVRIKKWITSRTKLLDSLPETERTNLCSDKLKTSTKVFMGIAFVLLCLFGGNISYFINRIFINGSNFGIRYLLEFLEDFLEDIIPGFYFDDIQSYFNVIDNVSYNVFILIINYILTYSVIIPVGISLFTSHYDRYQRAIKASVVFGSVLVGEFIINLIMDISNFGNITSIYGGFFLNLFLTDLFELIGIVFMYMAIWTERKNLNFWEKIQSDNSKKTFLLGAILLGFATGVFYSNSLNINSLGLYWIRFIILMACVAVAVLLLLEYGMKSDVLSYVYLGLLGATLLLSVYVIIERFFNISHQLSVVNGITYVLTCGAIFAAIALASISILNNNQKAKLPRLLIIIGCSVLFVLAVFVEFAYPPIVNSINSYSYNRQNTVDNRSYNSSQSESSYEDIQWWSGNNDYGKDLYVGREMKNTENLRIRESASQNSATVVILKKGSQVQIRTVGKKDRIDGISGNWVKVEVLSDYDRDGDWIPYGTIGWCFSGYLK